MGAGKVIGGLFALIGGALLAVAVFYFYFYHITDGIDFQMMRWIIHLVICLLAIVGGILAMAGKKAGGVLALIAGFMAFLMPLIVYIAFEFPVTYWFSPYAGLSNLVGWGSFTLTGVWPAVSWGITLEAVLIFFGAIIILSSRSDDI